MNEIGSWLHTLWLVGLVVLMWAALWCAWKILAWLQPRFWPPARRQERLRIRLRKTRDELRRDRVAEETSVASRLTALEEWADSQYRGRPFWEWKAMNRQNPLSPEEVEEALHIPQTGNSLDGSWPGTTPPADQESIESTSSPSSSVRAPGSRAP